QKLSAVITHASELNNEELRRISATLSDVLMLFKRMEKRIIQTSETITELKEGILLDREKLVKTETETIGDVHVSIAMPASSPLDIEKIRNRVREALKGWEKHHAEE